MRAEMSIRNQEKSPMKFRISHLVFVGLLLPAVVLAQDTRLKLPDFHGLSAKATDSVHISLGPWLLHMAGAFIDDKDEDSEATKQMLKSIKSIEIHSYTFATDFAYSRDDIDAVRKQLSAPGWTQLMQVHDSKKNEDVDMYVSMEDNHSNGFALIASEPREFTIINIVGSFSADDLPKLEKHLHLKMSGNQARLLM
jgi:Domain of unknown function (DUF4252)